MKPCVFVVDFSDGSFLVRHINDQLEFSMFNRELSELDAEIIGVEIYDDEEMVS